jgi:hypothetical protein
VNPLHETWKKRGLNRLRKELEWRDAQIQMAITVRDSLKRIIKKKEKVNGQQK